MPYSPTLRVERWKQGRPEYPGKPGSWRKCRKDKSNKCFNRDERMEYKRGCPLDTLLERPFVSVHLCALCVCAEISTGKNREVGAGYFGKTNGTMSLFFIFSFLEIPCVYRMLCCYQ